MICSMIPARPGGEPRLSFKCIGIHAVASRLASALQTPCRFHWLLSGICIIT
jgi:hypothetical protein